MTAVNETPRDLVFVSYSHADVTWLERLKTHLKPFERQGVIEVWDDRRIGIGEQWREEIRIALARARVAVLLVSPDYLASDFIAQHELPRLLSSEQELRSKVVWIPVRPSNLEATELREYQAALDPKRALAEMDEAEADRALVVVSMEILKIYQAGLSSKVGFVANHSSELGSKLSRGRDRAMSGWIWSGVALLAALAIVVAFPWLDQKQRSLSVLSPEEQRFLILNWCNKSYPGPFFTVCEACAVGENGQACAELADLERLHGEDRVCIAMMWAERACYAKNQPNCALRDELKKDVRWKECEGKLPQ